MSKASKFKSSQPGRSATFTGLLTAFAGAAMAMGVGGARATDVTYERLLHPEPQNWLMNHRTYDAQRYSPLDTINTSNVKGMNLLFSVALGGTAGNESIEATPLVEDGFMYMVDGWGVVYKIDVRDGSAGRILWKMDPGEQRQDRNRGAALWGNLVISVTCYDGRVIATDKENGKIVWDKNLRDQEALEINAAPLALKDSIIVGASGGDRGVRDWVVALDPRTGDVQWKTYSVPAPGEPGSETWKDKNNAWQTGGGAFYVTGSYDPDANLTYWGSGNPVPSFDSSYRPGDNLFTSSAIGFDATTGKMKWYFQYTPNLTFGYDETGSHIIIDTKVNGEDRKLLSHVGRNGFNYTLDLNTGQFLKAVQYVTKVTWTKGIDPKTGKPVDYDPGKDQQTDAGPGARILAGEKTSVCPTESGGTNHWPASYSRKTGFVYIPETEGCGSITLKKETPVPGNSFNGGLHVNDFPLVSGLVMIDPAAGELKKRVDLPYPNSSGVLTTAGGIVVTGLLDGTVMAFDDRTLDVLWKMNVGTGLNAPPMTYAVNGKQYIAIASGLFGNSRREADKIPDLKNLGNATMLFVFGL